ncbi:MAG: ATP-binding cassette domain-containing protein, partial [Ktedonobacteraceae bacterium]
MTTVSSFAGHVNSANKLLEINNLNVEYYAANGTVHALADVSITLERGQILGVAGESGSGKSTLAYAITRLLRPPAAITGGQILYYPQASSRLLDHTAAQKNSRAKNASSPENILTEASPQAMDILQLTPTQLRAFRWSELSIVFQSAMNALNPVLDIGTQIIDVLRTHRPTLSKDARRTRAIELLRLVGIAPDRIHSYPHELSGGMRQRAIIAIALALSPELIILD